MNLLLPNRYTLRVIRLGENRFSLSMESSRGVTGYEKELSGEEIARVVCLLRRGAEAMQSWNGYIDDGVGRSPYALCPWGSTLNTVQILVAGKVLIFKLLGPKGGYGKGRIFTTKENSHALDIAEFLQKAVRE